VVHLELSPGVVIVVPAWLLNAAQCAAMELGAPMGSLEALADLHLLLRQLGLRRSCASVHPTGEEPHDPVTPNQARAVDLGAATPTSTASTEHGV